MNAFNRLKKWSNTLGETSTPEFGQLALCALLFVSILLVGGTQLSELGQGSSFSESTFASSLPTSFIESGTLLSLCRYGFYIAAAGWLFRCCLPLSSWATVFFYTLFASIYGENLPWFRHSSLVPMWLLPIFALWFHFYRQEIQTALQRGDYWKTPLFPQWAYSASVFCIAIFFTFCGLSKLLSTGLIWGDGLSLQIWSRLLGDAASPLTRFILADRINAMILQSGVLAFECMAFLAIFSRRYRVAIGLGLIGFYTPILLAFGIEFMSNIALLALFFMPVREYAPAVASKFKAAFEYSFTLGESQA